MKLVDPWAPVVPPKVTSLAFAAGALTVGCRSAQAGPMSAQAAAGLPLLA